MNKFFRRIYFLLTKRRRMRELEEEMAAHRELLARDTGGHFGNDLRLREDSREAWGWTWLDRFIQDLQYGQRVLRRSPSFTLAAVAILALGIGANLSAFHLFNVTVLRPLPVRDPDSIFRFTRKSPGGTSTSVSYPLLEFLRRHNTVLSSVVGLSRTELTFGEDSSIRVQVQFVTSNFFTELGATAAYGRVFDPQTDDAPGAGPFAVLDYGFWQRQFSSNPFIIGSTIRLNGRVVTIVGVAPYDFSGLRPDNSVLWLPITQQPLLVEGSDVLTNFAQSSTDLYGRVKPGFSASAAEDALAPLMQSLHSAQPEFIFENERLVSQPGAYIAGLTFGRNEETAVALMLVFLVFLILVVACANLGGLLLARAVVRERELSIRMAVGAGRWRIVRQLLTESLLLSLLGGVAGIALSALGVRVLFSVLNAPRALAFALDYRMALCALAVSFLTTFLFGLAPALSATRQGYRAHRARRVLVGVQVGAGCVLLIVAGLLVRSLRYALVTHPGFEYKNVVSVDPVLDLHGYKGAAAAPYWEALEVRVSQIPGVDSVALASIPPLGNRVTIHVYTRPVKIRAYSNEVDPSFFSLMAIPIVRGRTFTPGERNAVIVSESLARNRWPGEDPVGKALSDDERAPIVVGVAGSARTVAIRDAEATEIYFPIHREAMAALVLLVKTSGPPESVTGALHSAAVATDPKALPTVTLLKDSFHQRMEDSQQAALVVACLGSIAVLLAVAGVYGQVCYAVSQRQREIGVRMALGARSSDIISLILRQFLKPVAGGIVAGVAAGAALSIVLRHELYGLNHLDPLSYAAAILLLAVLAGVAALIPARKVLRVNPVEVLRHE